MENFYAEVLGRLAENRPVALKTVITGEEGDTLAICEPFLPQERLIVLGGGGIIPDQGWNSCPLPWQVDS